MGIYLPLIKCWNKKASKKTHKMLNNSYIQNLFSKNIFWVFCKLGRRWRTICISWKLVALAKFLKSQGFKSTFQKNLTCIFLSLRANSKNPVCHDWPCIPDVISIILSCVHPMINDTVITYFGPEPLMIRGTSSRLVTFFAFMGE